MKKDKNARSGNRILTSPPKKAQSRFLELRKFCSQNPIIEQATL